MNSHTFRSLFAIITLAIVTRVNGNTALFGFEPFPQSLLSLQVSQEKSSVSLSGSHNLNSSLTLSATKIPFAGGTVRYYGYVPYRDSGKTLLQNISFNTELGDLSTTFFLSHRFMKNKTSQRSSRKRSLTGGVSIHFPLAKRWSLYGSSSLGQTFLTANSIDYDDYRSEFYYREYRASDLNISINGTAGISFLYIVRQKEPYQLFAGLQYDGNWFRPDPRCDETLVDYAQLSRAKFLAFQRDEFTKNSIGAHVGVIGPSKMCRTLPFKRATGVIAPSLAALTSLNFNISQYWSRRDHRSINYHFTDGIIDTSSVKVDEKGYRFVGHVEGEILFLRHLYTGVSLRIIRFPIWDFSCSDSYDIMERSTVLFEPFAGIRGRVWKSFMVDCTYSISFLEAEDDTYRITAGVTYLF